MRTIIAIWISRGLTTEQRKFSTRALWFVLVFWPTRNEKLHLAMPRNHYDLECIFHFNVSSHDVI